MEKEKWIESCKEGKWEKELTDIKQYKISNVVKEFFFGLIIYIPMFGLIPTIIGVFVSLFWGYVITKTGFSLDIVKWFAIIGGIIAVYMAYIVAKDEEKNSVIYSNLRYISSKIFFCEENFKNQEEVNYQYNIINDKICRCDSEFGSQKRELENLIKKYSSEG